MPIIPFFSDESITLEESLSSLSEVIESSTEEQKEEETTVEIPTEEDSTQEVTTEESTSEVITEKEEVISDKVEEVVSEEKEKSNINVTINGEPAILPSTKKTEEESEVLEEAEFETELESETESTIAEMQVLNTMLDCSKYCSMNNIYRLEEQASVILGYEYLHPATEGFRELVTKVWKFVSKKAIAIWNWIKKQYDKYVNKPLRNFITETQVSEKLSKNREAFANKLREAKGKYFKFDKLDAAGNTFTSLMPELDKVTNELTSRLGNLKNAVVENGQLKMSVDLSVITNKVESIKKSLSGDGAVEGSLADAGYKAEESCVSKLLDTIDNKILKQNYWTKFGTSLEKLKTKAEQLSNSAMNQDDQQTAENAKAVTTTVTALQQSVAPLLMLTTAVYNTGKSYTKVFTSATKTETTTQEPASTL